MSATDLSSLYTPITINGLELPNRFVMPGMQRAMAHLGAPTPRMAAIYRSRAEGGVSLVISESTAIDHYSADWQPTATRIADDTIGAWEAVIAEVHAGGGRFFQQLWHCGAMRSAAPGEPELERPSLSPSGLVHPDKPEGKAMTLDELGELKDAYVRAALLARDAGADGVEVHGAHGYLLDQFLWHGTNVRTDGYGGADVADRVRFPAEVVAAIRSAAGPDFPISFRLSQWKEVDFEASIVETPEELRILLSTLEDAGVDVFHVSSRRFYRPEWPALDPRRSFAGWASTFVSVPVITVGSIGLSTDLAANLWLGEETTLELEGTLPELAARFADGEFDLVAIGRSLLSDPDWVHKVRDGRYDEVIPYRTEILTEIAEGWTDGAPEEIYPAGARTKAA